MTIADTPLHRVCWVDLATPDETAASAFYERLFGWQAHERRQGAGRFGMFTDPQGSFASLYRLSRQQLANGVPAHWTPYVAVADVNEAAAAAAAHGAQIIISPHNTDLARISLICDPSGALIGLWQDAGGVGAGLPGGI